MSNPVTPLTTAQTIAAGAKAQKHSYPVRVLLALDEFGAALFGARSDTTISGDAAIAAVDDKGFKQGYGKTMSAFLNLFQKNHGAKAVAGDAARAEAAEEYDDQSGLINQPAAPQPDLKPTQGNLPPNWPSPPGGTQNG